MDPLSGQRKNHPHGLESASSCARPQLHADPGREGRRGRSIWGSFAIRWEGFVTSLGSVRILVPWLTACA